MSYDINYLNSLQTTSSKIRYLAACGMSRGDIARKLSTPEKTVRYQHVRNVLIQDAKKPAPTPMSAGDLGIEA